MEVSTNRARWWAGWCAAGVAAYVTSWILAGLWTPGYDARRQAISELFAIGAPAGPRILMTAALLATGALLVAFGPALDRLLPGTGRGAPIATMVSGVATMLVPAFPCTAGCPGFGTTITDSLHLVAAATGYLTLIATPLLVARRVRDHDPRLARISLVLGTIAAIGFVVGATAQLQDIGGWIQRGYNTVADLWYVIAGTWLARRPVRSLADQPATTIT